VLFRIPYPGYSAGENYPYFLSEYAILGAFADMLTANGQLEKSAAVKNEAEAVILAALDLLERQQGQTSPIQYITYQTTSPIGK
jgi:hypothetical protein